MRGGSKERRWFSFSEEDFPPAARDAGIRRVRELFVECERRIMIMNSDDPCREATSPRATTPTLSWWPSLIRTFYMPQILKYNSPCLEIAARVSCTDRALFYPLIFFAVVVKNRRDILHNTQNNLRWFFPLNFFSIFARKCFWTGSSDLYIVAGTREQWTRVALVRSLAATTHIC